MLFVKRLLSMVLAISMVAVLCISPMAITVTQHTNPSTGGPCNNTYYTYRHGTAPSAQNGWHYHTDGRVCNITAVTYVHECYCSSCGAYVGSYVKECTVRHTICGNYSVNCSE